MLKGLQNRFKRSKL